MSVIPLTTDGPNPTVVQNQTEFNIEGRAVLVVGLEAGQFTEQNASNVSYDLRIGSRYRDHREREDKPLGQNGVITLHPGSAIIIRTEEYLHLPRCMFGSIAPKVSLLQVGLSTTYSKVDPGYNGNLLITLFNLGRGTVKLPRGERFCAITILEVGANARLYDKGPKEITVLPAKQPRKSVKEWLESYHIFVTVGLIIATLLLALEHLLTFFISRMHP